MCGCDVESRALVFEYPMRDFFEAQNIVEACWFEVFFTQFWLFSLIVVWSVGMFFCLFVLSACRFSSVGKEREVRGSKGEGKGK